MTRLQFPKKLLVATLGSAFLALGYATPSMAASFSYSGGSNLDFSYVGDPDIFSDFKFSNFLSLSKNSFDPTRLITDFVFRDNSSKTDYEYLLLLLLLYFLYHPSNGGSSAISNPAISGDSIIPPIAQTYTEDYPTISGEYPAVLGKGRKFHFHNDPCLEPVPEPLTILGTLTAAGVGATFRRQQKKALRKA